jgi:hypothetical protein
MQPAYTAIVHARATNNQATFSHMEVTLGKKLAVIWRLLHYNI